MAKESQKIPLRKRINKYFKGKYLLGVVKMYFLCDISRIQIEINHVDYQQRPKVFKYFTVIIAADETIVLYSSLSYTHVPYAFKLSHMSKGNAMQMGICSWLHS